MDFVRSLSTVLALFAISMLIKKKNKPPVKSGLPAGEVFGIRVTLDTSDTSKIKSLDPYPTESGTVVSVSTTLCLGGLLS